MAQKFRANRRPDPRLDASVTISLLLTRQTKGYKNADPAAKHEKALPVSFYRFLHSAAVTEFDRAIAFLCTLAFFFAMRSCEYTETSVRRTKTLTVADFRFYKDKKEVPHSDPNLHNATTVTITFRYQKNDQRDDSITQERNRDPTICPVKAAAYTIRRLQNLPGCTAATTIDTFIDFRTGKFVRFQASALLALFRATATAMGSALLGLKLLKSELIQIELLQPCQCT